MPVNKFCFVSENQLPKNALKLILRVLAVFYEKWRKNIDTPYFGN